jgi:hypothetical protein
MHAALLAFVIVGFASAPKFEDASEATPVDTVTNAEFEQMMGERTAKAPAAVQPVKEAPPLPPQAPPELRKAEETPPPPPPPPPRPEPPKPEPPKPPPPEPPVKPVPPPPKPDALEKPQPPAKPKIVDAQPPERPREASPPKPVEKPPEKPKPDQLAKLLADASTKEPAKEAAKSSAKPFDPRAIARLIGETKPSSSTSQSNPGAPTAHAQRMSGSQERQLDDWFKEAYMACWSPPPTTPEGEVYIPEVQVNFNADGSLNGQPVLVNPPPDPAWRAHAESAVRAALRCNPMKIPAQYSPFFEQWRTKTIHFDPREALG